MTWSGPSMQGDLSVTADIDRTPQDPHGFLWSMEAHRILRHDEVDHELTAPMGISRRRQPFGNGFVLVGLNIVNQVHQSVECGVS